MTEYKDVLRIHLNSESDASFILRERQWAYAIDTGNIVVKLAGGAIVTFSPTSELTGTPGTISKFTETGLTDSLITENAGTLSLSGDTSVEGLLTSTIGVIAPGFATGVIIGTGTGQLISGRNLAISTSAHFAGPVSIHGASNGIAADQLSIVAADPDSAFRFGNNTNNSLDLNYTRSDGASVLSINGHSLEASFGGSVSIGQNISVGTSATIPRIVVPVGGVFRNDGEAQVYTNPESGLVLIGRAGTATNWTLVNNSNAGASVMDNPAGGLNVRFYGNVQTPFELSGSHVQTNTLNVSGVSTFVGTITALAGLSVPDNQGAVSTISSTARLLWGRSGSTLIIGESAGWSGNVYRSGGSHTFSINGTDRFQVVAGGAIVDGGLVVSGTGSFASGKLYFSSTDGMVLAGRTGSAYDFSLVNPAGSQYLIRNPTGTNNLQFPSGSVLFGGAVAMASTLSISGNSILGSSLNVSGSAEYAGTLTGYSGIWSIRNGIGSTSTDGLSLDNSVAATVDQKQISPRLRLSGRGWKSDATAGSQSVDWILENSPVAGTANPSTILSMASQINAGGYTNRLTLNSNGLVSIPNGQLHVGYEPNEAFPMLGMLDVRAQGDESLIAVFGEDDSPGYIYMSHINAINSGYHVNGNAQLYLNYRGYQGGTDQFRDVRIYDGKGGQIAQFDGSSSVLRVKHSVSTNEPVLGVGGEIGFGGDIYNLSTPPTTSGTDIASTATPSMIKVKYWTGSAWEKWWIQATPNATVP